MLIGKVIRGRTKGAWTGGCGRAKRKNRCWYLGVAVGDRSNENVQSGIILRNKNRFGFTGACQDDSIDAAHVFALVLPLFGRKPSSRKKTKHASGGFFKRTPSSYYAHRLPEPRCKRWVAKRIPNDHEYSPPNPGLDMAVNNR